MQTTPCSLLPHIGVVLLSVVSVACAVPGTESPCIARPISEDHELGAGWTLQNLRQALGGTRSGDWFPEQTSGAEPNHLTESRSPFGFTSELFAEGPAGLLEGEWDTGSRSSECEDQVLFPVGQVRFPMYWHFQTDDDTFDEWLPVEVTVQYPALDLNEVRVAVEAKVNFDDLSDPAKLSHEFASPHWDKVEFQAYGNFTTANFSPFYGAFWASYEWSRQTPDGLQYAHATRSLGHWNSPPGITD
jgi:hypothetical protein